MIIHRGRATGRYALTSSHIGGTMLGSYVPGAGAGWVEPTAYLATKNSTLLLITVNIFDPYAKGNFPGRIYQVVRINGAEVLRHDIADTAWSGWIETPLEPNKEFDIAIEIFASNPDPGWRWGDAVDTTIDFELTK